MPTIFLGPDNKSLGLRYNQIFTADLPISEGDFPLHVKQAVLENPALANSFMAFDAFVSQRPRVIAEPLGKPPVQTSKPLGQEPPINKRPGLRKG